MILQALTEHYETLAAQGKVDVLGWGKAKISYALCIRDDGGQIGRASCRERV